MMISNKLIKETKTINMYHIIVGNALTIKALWISKRIFSMLRKSLIDSENSLLQFFKTNSIFAKKNPEFLHCSTPVQVTKYLYCEPSSTRYSVNSLPVTTITSKLLKIVMKENVWTIAIMSTLLQQRCFANSFK